MFFGTIAAFWSASLFPLIYYLNGQVAGVFVDYQNIATIQLEAYKIRNFSCKNLSCYIKNV
jgi:hypothetical protein